MFRAVLMYLASALASSLTKVQSSDPGVLFREVTKLLALSKGTSESTHEA